MMRKPVSIIALLAACFLPAMEARALDTSCQLDHPIVLSHHWSAKKICDDATLEDAPPECRATPEELKAGLPPRTRNLRAPDLSRPSAVLYYRYYSLAIVDRLRRHCGNQVFLADKPPFASYEARARSLRGTVLRALEETGAQKVVIIGMSQGVQDARYMVTEFPVDEDHPDRGMMRSRVESIVSVVGEDGGAESASLLLDAVYVANGGEWSSTAFSELLGLSSVREFFWTDSQGDTVLSGSCTDDCVLETSEDLWRTVLHSVTVLSTKYMRPNTLQTHAFTESWDRLRRFLGMAESEWADVVEPAEEGNNGVYYFSYAAAILTAHPEWDTQTLLTWPIIEGISGANDGQVSVERQKFRNPSANFTHIKTLDGHWASRGYHHMWFAGRDDELLGPATGYREDPPYDGGSADFYEQVARDLRAMGF